MTCRIIMAVNGSMMLRIGPQILAHSSIPMVIGRMIMNTLSPKIRKRLTQLLMEMLSVTLILRWPSIWTMKWIIMAHVDRDLVTIDATTVHVVANTDIVEPRPNIATMLRVIGE